MGMDPVTLLVLLIEPTDTPEWLLERLISVHGVEHPYAPDDVNQISVGGVEYDAKALQAYEEWETYGVYASTDVVALVKVVVSGWSELVEWEFLEKLQLDLKHWADKRTAEFPCSCKIFISAHYW